MPVVISPLGVRCNLKCTYCYEDSLRAAGNFGGSFDVASIKEAVQREGGGPFLLFGGEPLLLPKETLHDLWEWGFLRTGGNSLQTNGILVDDDHIELFKRFNVRVGISIDGPDSLNDARWKGTLEETRSATRCVQDTIARLCAEGIPPSLIVVLHRLNASQKALPRLMEWLKDLAGLGVRRITLHLLEIETEEMRESLQLTVDENVEALLQLRAIQTDMPTMRFSLLEDMQALLSGDDENAKCIWKACDPYTTAAVRGVGGRGERSKCGRVIKDGVDHLRDVVVGYERYIALYQTPYNFGGCEGCRFFLMCRGQCPGTSVDGDWRNRSEQCPVWFRLFEHMEAEMLLLGQEPLSLSSYRAMVESEMIRNWENGRNVTISSLLKSSSLSAQRQDQ
jgi:uncharacterized protein